MFETKEIELENGKKMILREEEVNYMAFELINFLPLYILRQWLIQTTWIHDDFKPILLKMKEEKLKEKLAYMCAFFVSHRRYKIEQTKEEI